MPLPAYPVALRRLLDAVAPLPPATTPLAAAAGRVVAAAVASPGAVPPFRNAALDGYAVRGADLAAADTTLRLVGTSLAGSLPGVAVGAGEAVAITTGAPLPAGADTVVPVERVRGRDGRTVTLAPGTAAGANVRAAGEDFAAGALVLAAGQRLGPEALMALGATGIGAVPTRGPVRVAVLTTGSELRAAGTPGAAASIGDANGPFLAGFLPRAGAVCVAAETAPDRLDDLVAALARLAGTADVVVTTGGVSAGSHDLVPAAVAAAGGTPLFHKVAIRPGKPVLAARLAAGPWLLGLPGNPVAVAATARFFLVPLLRALLGQPAEPVIHARSLAALRARGELTFFGKARVTAAPDGGLTVALLPGQESFRVAPLVAANAWVVVPPEPAAVAAGDPVAVVPLDPGGDWLAPGP
jgi:molybdopterin molybdotransferase